MSLYLKRLLGYAKVPIIIFLVTLIITSSTIITLTNNKVSDNIPSSIALIYTISLSISAIITALYQYNIYLNDEKELFYLQGSSLRKIQFLVPIFAHYTLFILLDLILVLFLYFSNVTLEFQLDSLITILFASKYIICAMILFFYTLSDKLLDFIILLLLGCANAIFMMKIVDASIIAPFIITLILVILSYIIHYIKRRYHLYDVIEFIKIVCIITLFIISFENILISGELYKHSVFSFNFNGVIVNYGPLLILIFIALYYNFRKGNKLFNISTLFSFIIVPILCGSLILVYKDIVYLRADSNSESFNVGVFGIKYNDNRSIDINGDEEYQKDIIKSLKKKAEYEVSSNKIDYLDYDKLNNESKVVISDYDESNFVVKEKDFKRVFREAGIRTNKVYLFNNPYTNNYYVISNKHIDNIDWNNFDYGGNGKIVENETLYNKLNKLDYSADGSMMDDYQLQVYYTYKINDIQVGSQSIGVNKKISKKELKELNKEIIEIQKRGGQ